MQAKTYREGCRQPKQRTVLAQPKQGRHAQNNRVKHEQHRMQPLLGGLAVLRVNPLVLGDEQARERCEGDKNSECSG